ncbi:sulfatase [Planctomycetaceae bacterium SCGC AG-212-F19]|nr:sulfatase [Planctomycetaceae bacterium SCGC AG-212-F19]
MQRLLFLGVLVAAVLPTPAWAQARKPNILVIVADDLGYADVGCHGCKDIPTPNIDALAKNGVRCTNGYVSGPYCSPTRAGLMTGRYQTRFGHEFNPGTGPEIGLPLSETTIADRFKTAGYVTGLVGKWHLGSAAKFHPVNRGFQEHFGFLGGMHTYFPEQARTIFRGMQAVQEKEYLTDAFGREAIAFIDRHQKDPFLLYLAFNAVHTPMEATEKYLARFPNIANKQRRTYAAMTAAMDDAIGNVMAKLRAAGLEENTLVFFFSDNGGPTMVGTTINGSSNAPLRGSKRQTLEGGIRVPWIVQWKGRISPGKTFEQPVIQLDVLPTALAAAGVEVSKDWKLDGVNLLPHFEGKNVQPPHDTLYWRFGTQMAIRRGDWKLVQYDNTGRKLYNLTADIGEATDLLAKEPERAKELEATWRKWDGELAKPLWGAGPKPQEEE